MCDYDRVIPIQKAAVRMPVRSSIRRRRCLRTATIITPMAQSRKPSSGQNMARVESAGWLALAGSSSQKDANEVAAVSDAATGPRERQAFRPLRHDPVFFRVAPVHPSLRDHQCCDHQNEQRHVPLPASRTVSRSLKAIQLRRRPALRSEISDAENLEPKRYEGRCCRITPSMRDRFCLKRLCCFDRPRCIYIYCRTLNC